MVKVVNFENVDKLAAINAQIAALQADADELKAKIVKSGFSVIESENYKCVVSKIQDSVAVNYRKVAEVLAGKVSAQVYSNAVKKASGVKKGYVKVALYDL